MRCKAALNELMRLDNGEAPSPALREHLASCSACGLEYRRLGAGLRMLSRSLPAGDLDLSAAIMTRIGAEELLEPPLPNVSLTAWISAALLIALGMCVLPYSATFIAMRLFFGRGFDLTMSMILGAALTAYTMLLIGTNLPWLEKRFGIRH